MTRNSVRTLAMVLVALTTLTSTAESQQKWKFGPVAPHAQDAMKRSAYAFAIGAAFMGVGLGIDALNRAQCRGTTTACFGGNPVQAGVGFGFLGTLIGGTTPLMHSKCTRSGRAILGIVGAAIGATAAGAIMDVRLFNAKSFDPATFRTMTTGLTGMSLGAGVATAIC